MNTSRATLKLWARSSLLGKYGTAVGALMIVYGIAMGLMIAMEVFIFAGGIFSLGSYDVRMPGYLVAVILIISVIIMFLEMMMAPGIVKLYLNISKGEKGQVSDVFFAFKNHMWKFVGIVLGICLISIVLMLPNLILSFSMSYTGDYSQMLFSSTFSAIYMLILMVFFVYIGLNYGQFFVILAENPEKGILEALLESRELMKGNRGRYFLLQLSFLGWILLMYCTFYIGMLWILPYMGCTYVQFYLDLKPRVEEISPQWQESVQE